MVRVAILLFFTLLGTACMLSSAGDEAAPSAEIDTSAVEAAKKDNLALDTAVVDAANKIAEQDVQNARIAQNNMDLLLYGGLVLLVLGVPAVIYKVCCSSGDSSPAGLAHVMASERGAKTVAAAQTTRYNTEQLRQTVARLRAQV